LATGAGADEALRQRAQEVAGVRMRAVEERLEVVVRHASSDGPGRLASSLLNEKGPQMRASGNEVRSHIAAVLTADVVEGMADLAQTVGLHRLHEAGEH